MEKLIKTLRWIARNEEDTFNAETANKAAEAIEELQGKVAQGIRNCENCAAVVRVIKKSPCESCTVSTNPDSCQKKSCGAWKDWWLGRWELIRAYGEKHRM